MFGSEAYIGTIYYENDYDRVIKDNYYCSNNCLVSIMGDRFTGSEDEVTFEDLEARRLYPRRLIEECFSRVSFNMK